MPSKGKRYENRVLQIMLELRDQVKQLPSVEVSRCRTRQSGASGYGHKIDLSIRVKDELTLLECKCWNRKIDPEAVLCLAGRVCDIRAANRSLSVRGAIVTKIGLGPGAGTVADYFGIEIYQVQNEHDFGVRFAEDIHRRVAEEGMNIREELRVSMMPSVTDQNCPRCQGEGWICEEHMDRPWPHPDPSEPTGRCGGPGIPCVEPGCPFRTHETNEESARRLNQS
jgi:hypothetical protein